MNTKYLLLHVNLSNEWEARKIFFAKQQHSLSNKSVTKRRVQVILQSLIRNNSENWVF